MKMPTVLSLVITAGLMANAAFAENETPADPLVAKIGIKRLELALSLSQALDTGKVCDADAYPTEIVREVEGARFKVSDATMKGFIKRVGAKSAMQANLAFREATGQTAVTHSNPTEAELTKALLGTTFHHFGQGAYGSGYNVTLAKGGVAREKTMELLDDAPYFRWKNSATSWKLVKHENAPIVGFYLEIGGVQFRLDNETQGDLNWIPLNAEKDSPDYYRQTLSTSDSFCDA